jgi:transposase
MVRMRGKPTVQTSFVSLIDIEALIAPDHPIRRIKALVDEVLRSMSSHFDQMYVQGGRPSIPPERLLKAKVLQALFTVRSDRQLCARLQTDLMFRWFIDLPLDEAVFDASTFSQNQARLLQHAVADVFFAEVVELAQQHGWISNDHFSVDGTLIQAWASIKSFKPKGGGKGPGKGNPWTDFKGEKRSNETHASTTDPEAKLLKKAPGQEARLCFAGHATMENRNGLCVLFDVCSAVGEPESKVAVAHAAALKQRGFRPKSIGADKGYHTEGFVEGLREQGITPHPALCEHRKRRRIRRSSAYSISQRIRKRVEEIFGWMKTTGGFRKSRYRGLERSHAAGQYVVAALNLLRMAKLIVTNPPKWARA